VQRLLRLQRVQLLRWNPAGDAHEEAAWQGCRLLPFLIGQMGGVLAAKQATTGDLALPEPPRLGQPFAVLTPWQRASMLGRGVSTTHAAGAAAPRLGMRARRRPPSRMGRTRPSSSAAIMTVAVRMLFPFPSGAGAARR
jgi:hypothetical protein